jgi:hypothetical protein
MRMALDLGGLQDLFSRGVDAWKDIEVSKNYAANNPSPATRDANGNPITQGEYAGGGLGGALANNPIALPLIVVLVGVLAFMLVKKL